MLILQCVECHIDHADTLLRNEFSFLPAWQIDDTMARIGNDGASCGLHFDRYDVFLLQLTVTKTCRLDAGGRPDWHGVTPVRRFYCSLMAITIALAPLTNRGSPILRHQNLPDGARSYGSARTGSRTVRDRSNSPDLIVLMLPTTIA